MCDNVSRNEPFLFDCKLKELFSYEWKKIKEEGKIIILGSVYENVNIQSFKKKILKLS